MRPILINVGEIMPKQIKPTKFPYHRKHDPNATCGYHPGHVGNSIENYYLFKAWVQKLIDQKLMCFTPKTTEVPIEKEFEYKGPPIHVQVHLSVVQPTTQYQYQGYHPEIPFSYPRASSFTAITPQYTYPGAPYVSFGVQYGHTSNQIVNPALMHSAQMFPPMENLHIYPRFQVPLMPVPYYSFSHGVTTRYQQPPQAQILLSQ